MKKQRVILIVVFAVIVMVLSLFWPKGDVSLEFVGYKWNQTNRTWSAVFWLINNTRQRFECYEDDNAVAPFVYRFYLTNDVRTGLLLTGTNDIHALPVEPGQRVKMMAPFTLNDQFEDLDRKLGLNSHPNDVVFIPDVPLEIGVVYWFDGWPNKGKFDFIEQAVKSALRIKPTVKDALHPAAWCPQKLIVPTNPPPISSH